MEYDFIKVDKPKNFLEYENMDTKGIMVNISSNSIISLYNKYKDHGLFDLNIRRYIKSKMVDDGIKRSLDICRSDFWFLNNGIIIACKDYYIDGNTVKLHEFSIVNGGQTTNLIGEFKSKCNDEFYLPCKIVSKKEVKDVDYDFFNRIAEATNSQKPIYARDLKSNSSEMRRLQSWLSDEGIYLEIKRGVRIPKKKYLFHIKNDELGQLIFSFVHQRPGTARSNKKEIFENNKLYGQIYKVPYENDRNKKDCIVDIIKLNQMYEENHSTLLKSNRIDENEKIILKNGKQMIFAVLGLFYMWGNKDITPLDTLNDSTIVHEIPFIYSKIIGNYKKDDIDELMTNMLIQIIQCLAQEYENAYSSQKTSSVSNYFKKDSTYINDIIPAISKSYERVKYLREEINGYNQFTQRHILFLRPGYFIVTDHITSKDTLSHNYRQNWHFLPTANASINEYDQAVTNFPVDANLTIANVSEYGELESELCNGYYSKTAQGSSLEEYKYVSYNKNAIGNTSFQTILFPTAPGKLVDIQTEVLKSSIAVPDARAMRAIIKEENNKETETNYYILLDESKKTEATYGNYKTDASLTLSEHINEKLSRIIIRKGSYIESTAEGKYYLKLDSAVEDLGISFEPSKVVIESSKEDTNLTGLTLFIDKNDVSVVTYNGEEIPFNREENYIYLGEVPSFDIPEADGEDNNFDDNDSNYAPKEEGPTGSIGGGNSSGGGGGSSSGNNDDKEDEPSTPTVPEKMPSDAFSEELSSHWAENEISYLIDNGYVNGNGETLLLSHNITRAEFVKVIVGVLGLETGTYEGIFEDVQEDDWHSVYLECAYKNGLLSGFDDKALPNEAITREQMAKILSNAYSLKHNNASSFVKSSFTDEKNISVWAKEHIDTCYSLGLINGYEDGSFKPSNNTTRAEAFVTIYRFINNIR